MEVDSKRIESKLLRNFIKLLLADRLKKGYIMFYLEMTWEKNKTGLDDELIRLKISDLFKYEIENLNFSFFFVLNKRVVVVFTAINILGISSSWKTNFENKLTKWLFVSRLQQPTIRKIECDNGKVIAFTEKTLKRMKEDLITNCVIYRHSIDFNDIEPEIDDLYDVSSFREFSYQDKLVKFFNIKNKKPNDEKISVVINAINCYLDNNNLVLYKNVILKKVKNTEGCLEFFDLKENFDIKEVVSFLKTNFKFYFEYIDINSLLLMNYLQYKEIMSNSDYYLSSIRKVEVGVEYRNGFMLSDKTFVDKSNIINVLVSADREYTEEENKEIVSDLINISIRKNDELLRKN